MDLLIDWVADVVCHRIGLWTLKLLTFGRYRDKGSFGQGLSCAVGCLVIVAGIAIAISWIVIGGKQ
jgi:hypothetical protein